jgi:hypothetical protein
MGKKRFVDISQYSVSFLGGLKNPGLGAESESNTGLSEHKLAHLTPYLTRWSSALLANLIVAHLVKFYAFYGTRKFIIVLKRTIS